MEDLLEHRSPCCAAFIDHSICTSCLREVDQENEMELDYQEDY